MISKILKRKKRGEMTLSAVVYRADGTVEDLGVISKGKIDLKPRGGEMNG